MNTILNIFGFIFLICSTFVFGLKGMSVEMGIAVAGSGVLLAFINLEQFSKFKGAGFEAELKNTIKEANVTIENLREVAKPLIRTQLVTLANTGRWGNGSFRKNHELFDQLNELQSKFEVVGADLEQAKKQYLNIHAWDMVSDLSRSIEEFGIKGFRQKANSIVGVHDFDKPPNLDNFLKMISEIKIDESIQDHIKILKEYYRKYKL